MRGKGSLLPVASLWLQTWLGMEMVNGVEMLYLGGRRAEKGLGLLTGTISARAPVPWPHGGHWLCCAQGDWVRVENHRQGECRAVSGPGEGFFGWRTCASGGLRVSESRRRGPSGSRQVGSFCTDGGGSHTKAPGGRGTSHHPVPR